MLAFILFAFVASITPGPTNLIVLSTSARRGWRACVPIILGAGAGAALLVWIAGTGAGTALLALPYARTAMTALGLCWMLWLAWKLFTSPVAPLDAAASEPPRELGLVGALLLQWVNPKSWLMALAVIGVFTADGQPLTPLCMAFFLVALPCLGAWALLGRGAARWLSTPAHLRWMNRSLALLLVLSSGVALLQA
ncbi:MULTISPECIES: LysE family translocator [Pseudomonas]|uniref:LysE family translocator n=1 Tax=Pseudomonas quercus TaxID=2722792 RepID=A0ABX0YE86_9PSED|nr:MULTISPECIES: LysE family translocator [Pseudomonas]MBF7141991.1 LysE family translocator [Pseudomonas sp. LY10J]NJP00529.1 LysE family translocator [Pseudomonas quercus]